MQMEDDRKKRRLEELRDKKWEKEQLEKFKKESEEQKQFELEQQKKKVKTLQEQIKENEEKKKKLMEKLKKQKEEDAQSMLEMKKMDDKKEKEKKQSYKKPKFLYRLGITPSNIFNILSHVNDIDINKIRKRKIISEAKFKDIETPKTINTLYFNQEKIIIEKQGFNYLRELAKSLKDFEKCKRKSLKSSKTMILSVL